MDPDGDLVTQRLARGCRCYVAQIDETIAGYGWLSVGPEWIGEVELEIKPRPGEGYIWNCVTVPGHRRKGVFRSLLRGISARAGNEGLKRIWIGSVDIPAEKAVGPSGFTPALRFTSITVAGVHLMRVRRAADQGLAADASSVVGIDAGVHARRSHARRH
jgi:GNAT superfamily N-acetyltransferase